jgi:flagellin
MSEVERIAITTEFNGVKLLSGGQNIVFQVGFDGSSISQIGYSGVQATLASLGLAGAGTSVPTFSIIANTEEMAQSASRFALDALRAAIVSVSRNRGTLGAAESRLETTINNLTVIRDVDVASESAELTRLSILQQAGTAILAQANQQPRLALQLLGGG